MARCPRCHEEIAYLRNNLLKGRYAPAYQATCGHCQAKLRVRKGGSVVAFLVFFALAIALFNAPATKPFFEGHAARGIETFLLLFAVAHYLAWRFLVRFDPED